MLKEKNLFCRRNSMARMEPWSLFSHWEHVQIEARNSWIGIKGLPLNLWNYHAFKIRGEACEDLLEIAKDTLDQSFLLFAKIKVRGFKACLMPPILEVPCLGEMIHLGLFNLENNQTHSNGRTRGLIFRSIEGYARTKEASENEVTGVRFATQGKNSGEGGSNDGFDAEFPAFKNSGFNGGCSVSGVGIEKSTCKSNVESSLSWIPRGKQIVGEVQRAPVILTRMSSPPMQATDIRGSESRENM